MPQPTPEEDLVDYRLSPILGENYSVLHAVAAGKDRLDIYCWSPTEERNIWTLVTSGAHRHKMRTPEGFETFSRSEYVMTLPPDWPVMHINRQYQEGNEAAFWPLHLLKVIGQLVIEYDTWFSYGHTLQAGQELSDNFAGTDFCGVVFGGPLSIDVETDLLETPYEDGNVYFLGLYPIYLSEMVYAMDQHGADLLDKLNDADIHESLILDRRPVV